MTHCGSPAPTGKPQNPPIKHGLILAAFALGTAVILSASADLTRQAIADRATEDLYASLAQVIAEDSHDNDLTADLKTVEDSVEGSVPVYIAAQGPEVTGVAFVLSGFGYGGEIRVLAGIDASGTLTGVRVLSHAETPGLGDKIETAKSPWIEDFTGHSLTDPGPEGWKVQKDGGVFDQFSGATITPRAVVGTVQRALALFDRNRDTLLAPKEARS